MFKNQIKSEDILPRSDWYKKFEKYWVPSEQKAHENLDNFVNKNILNYGVDRDFPSIKGTSFIKILELREITKWKVPIFIKIAVLEVDLVQMI